MRYIIRRIIIGVGIALALMLITKTFSLSVYAANTYNIVPNELRLTYLNTSSNLNTTTYTSLQEVTDLQYPYNTFYGRTNINAGYFVSQQLYRLEASSSMKSGFYDLHFLFYSSATFIETSHLTQPFSFNLRNNSRVFTCSNDNGGGLPDTTSAPISNLIIGVTCSNVYLDLNNNNVVYAIIEQSDTKTLIGTAYGISAVNFQVNASGSIIQSQQETTQAVEENTQVQQETNDILNDDDTTDAQSSASNFFSGFSSTDHGGLSGVITAPLRFINNLLGTGTMSGRCTSISVPLPFVNNSVVLPCASTILFDLRNGDTLYNIISTITTGIIAYWVIVKIFAFVRSAKKPDEDRVEVLDL